MKTVYTDSLGLYPWAMLVVSGIMFWSAYTGFSQGDGNQLGLGIGAGAIFLILALRRLNDDRTTSAPRGVRVGAARIGDSRYSAAIGAHYEDVAVTGSK